MKSSRLSGIPLILIFVLSACAPLAGISQPLPATQAPVETLVPLYTPTVLVFPTPVLETLAPTLPALNNTAAPETSATPILTATPEIGVRSATPIGVRSATPDRVRSVTPTIEPRLPAEKWQQWPVVPTLTARARQVYLDGLWLGNDPHAFAKIGDCQFVNVAFFGIYDQPGLYAFPPGYSFLQQTVDWFSGSFNRASQAVRGGFNVASVFVPLQADPQFCLAGETPLVCEFRLTRPSIALISMETGFKGRTAAVYEKYMRQIIETAIIKGALPILATKADNFEGDHSINLTTARLAVEYDLPLWNFWRAVQPLPNHGMDPDRPDNFHISVEGWNVRSFTGLQALDAIWRAVRNGQ